MSADVKTVKAILLQAAYEGAVAVFENEPAVVLDPNKDAYSEFQNPELRKRALLIYEEAKIQYAALKAALEDNTIFPDPVLPVPTVPVAKPVTALPGQDIGANIGQVASLVGQVAGAISPVVPQAVPVAAVANAVANSVKQ